MLEIDTRHTHTHTSNKFISQRGWKSSMACEKHELCVWIGCFILCSVWAILFSCLAGCTDTVLLSVATYAAIIFVPYSFGMLAAAAQAAAVSLYVCASARERERERKEWDSALAFAIHWDYRCKGALIRFILTVLCCRCCYLACITSVYSEPMLCTLHVAFIQNHSIFLVPFFSILLGISRI